MRSWWSSWLSFGSMWKKLPVTGLKVELSLTVNHLEWQRDLGKHVYRQLPTRKKANTSFYFLFWMPLPWNILPVELLDMFLSDNSGWCFPFAFSLSVSYKMSIRGAKKKWCFDPDVPIFCLSVQKTTLESMGSPYLKCSLTPWPKCVHVGS